VTTRVIDVAPITATGALVKGYTLRTEPEIGQCFGWWEGLVCSDHSNPNGFEPCWPWNENRTDTAVLPTVACMDNFGQPWEPALTAFQVTDSPYKIPSWSHFDIVPAVSPEALELASNQKCTVFNGTPSQVGKTPVRYYCGTGKRGFCRHCLGLLDETITYNRHTFWTVRTAIYDDKASVYKFGPRVAIKVAWVYVAHE